MPPPANHSDEQLMRRAIRLAMNGRGRVEPNPIVGCVIAKDGRIIGEGWHERFGGPHAERVALERCTESPAGSTIYVTLEPCCHTNKKTPPCVPAVVAARPARVVIGCTDPNPQVSGRGVAQLRETGIDVTTPVLEAACGQLIAPFLAAVRHRRPYVTLKWAESADGKVAGPKGRRSQISNDLSTRVVHALRSRCDGIAVGIGTVLADDPLLTVRQAPILRPLRRIVLDTHLRTPPNSRLLSSGKDQVTIFCGTATPVDRRQALEAAGATVRPVPTSAGGPIELFAMLDELGTTQVTHLLVEPGPTLARRFFEQNLWDRLWVIRSPTVVDDPTAPAATPLPQRCVPSGTLPLAGDTLTEYLNADSPLFFAAEPSADFVLAGQV